MSIKIEVIGPAVAYDESGNRIASAKALRSLDGIAHPDDVISSYFPFGEVLDSASVSGGTVGIVYNAEKRRLEVVCTFGAPRRLKSGEREALLGETAGQLSDGIGEGCFDPVPGHPKIRVDVCPAGSRAPLRIVQTGTASGSSRRKTNLWAAATKGNVDGVLAALDSGTKVDELSKGYSALHLAITYGHIDAVRALLERGACVLLEDSEEFTPLHACIATSGIQGTKKRLELLNLLVDAGADVNAQHKHAGRPLAMSKGYGRGKAIQDALISRGAMQ